MYRIDKQYIENISLQKTIDIVDIGNVITPLKHWGLFFIYELVYSMRYKIYMIVCCSIL